MRNCSCVTDRNYGCPGHKFLHFGPEISPLFTFSTFSTFSTINFSTFILERSPFRNHISERNKQRKQRSLCFPMKGHEVAAPRHLPKHAFNFSTFSTFYTFSTFPTKTFSTFSTFAPEPPDLVSSPGCCAPSRTTLTSSGTRPRVLRDTQVGLQSNAA